MNPKQHRQRFDEFLSRQRGRLVAIARVYAGNDYEDLLQDILLQVWKSLDGFDQRSSVDTWAYRIAINTSLQWKRALARKQKYLPKDVVDFAQIPQDINFDAATMLDRFMSCLSESDKALLMMHLDDLSHEQMADVLGITDGAVRVRMHRLRKTLNQWEGAEE